jgi:hypothetical protein
MPERQPAQWASGWAMPKAMLPGRNDDGQCGTTPNP